jgi:hypothetical protein
MKKAIFLILIFFTLSFSAVSADQLTYQPITITMDNCDPLDDQVIFFDVYINQNEYPRNDEINEAYKLEFPNYDTYEYLIDGDDYSYLAYDASAEFFSVNCYTNIYSFEDENITSYKLVAYDIDGNMLHVSDTLNINEVGYDYENDLEVYYTYDPSNQSFEIATRPTDVSDILNPVNLLGYILLGGFLYAFLAMVGIVPYMIGTYKTDKQYYVYLLLITNFIFVISLMTILMLETNAITASILFILHFVINYYGSKFLDERLLNSNEWKPLLIMHGTYIGLFIIALFFLL